MELVDTAVRMVSADYKERFKAEYDQLKIRYDKLVEMCDKWDKGQLDFTPTCDRTVYNMQLSAMRKYKDILEFRALKEKVVLD